MELIAKHFKHRRSMPKRDRRGSMLLLIAVSLVFVLVGVVFSVDVAYMHLTRTELKAVTDLSASAAVEALTRTQDDDAGADAAIRIAGLHRVGGRTLELDDDDIVFGRHQFNGINRLGFAANQGPFTAVQVNGKLTDDSDNGSVSTFFAKVFGLNSFGIERSSIAAQLDRDIALVLDFSGSMGRDNRFEDMIAGVNVFLDEIILTPEVEQVSITSYNSTAVKRLVLTSNISVLRSTINAFMRDDIKENTGIGQGLDLGAQSLVSDINVRPLAHQQVILMTDGRHNTGINPLDVVPQIAARGHVVNTITFSAEANQELMIQVAEAAGGIHSHAADGTALVETFRNLARGFQGQLID